MIRRVRVLQKTKKERPPATAGETQPSGAIKNIVFTNEGREVSEEELDV